MRPRGTGGRTRIVLVAFAVMVAASVTELGGDFGLRAPQLGNLGSLLSAALLALASLRFRLLDQPFRLGAAREERARLAFLGRLSAQMAHDLKNPLAALRAMVQYLEGEIAAGRSIDGELGRLELIRGQIDRLTGVVDKYRRVGGVNPVLAAVDLNALLRGLVETARHDADADLRLELAAALPECLGDADLLGTALENLLRNGIDAVVEARTPDDRTRRGVTVRTQTAPPGRLLVEFEDEGAGIPASVREHVFDDFFTTKAIGSGLGLSFAKRVVNAHLGAIAIAGRPGGGTVMRVWLPQAAPADRAFTD